MKTRISGTARRCKRRVRELRRRRNKRVASRPGNRFGAGRRANRGGRILASRPAARSCFAVQSMAATRQICSSSRANGPFANTQQERRLAHPHSLGDALHDQTVAGRFGIYLEAVRSARSAAIPRRATARYSAVRISSAEPRAPAAAGTTRTRSTKRWKPDLSRYVVDRLLGINRTTPTEYSRHQLTKGDALQIPGRRARSPRF